MCKFVNLVIDRENSKSQNTHYLSNVIFLYSRYAKFLKDDYAPQTSYSSIIKLIEQAQPFFYIILDKKTEEFAGFIYLDNLIGNAQSLHSAEITVCFEKKFWGAFTKKTAISFFNYCFNILKFKKIKAQIYPFNNRVRNLLKFSGFQKDGVLRGETLKNTKLTDIEVYSLLNEDQKYINISETD